MQHKRVYSQREKRIILAVAMCLFAIYYLGARLAGLTWAVWW